MASPSAARAPLRCFLVEDSPIIRQNLEATLDELLGMRIAGSADRADTALSWLADHRAQCDLVIIDIFLKSGSGIEVLREARSLQPSARLVVLTNYATPDMRRLCLSMGADRVFDKSAELEELIAYCDEMAAGSSTA